MSDFLAITQRFASINESSSPKQARVSENDELRAVAEQFEAIFVQELMKASRAAKLFDDPLETLDKSINRSLALVIAVCALAIVLFFSFPNIVLDAASFTSNSIFSQ